MVHVFGTCPTLFTSMILLSPQGVHPTFPLPRMKAPRGPGFCCESLLDTSPMPDQHPANIKPTLWCVSPSSPSTTQQRAIYPISPNGTFCHVAPSIVSWQPSSSLTNQNAQRLHTAWLSLTVTQRCNFIPILQLKKMSPKILRKRCPCLKNSTGVQFQSFDFSNAI